MVINTLLTTPLTSDEIEALKGRELLWDKAHVITLDIWLEGYKAGDISLERMVREVHSALTSIKLPERSKQLLIGSMINEALSSPEPKRTRGGGKRYPTSLKKISASLVDLIASREKLPKSRYSPNQSAFDKAASVLQECGFNVSIETLIKWRREFHI